MCNVDIFSTRDRDKEEMLTPKHGANSRRRRSSLNNVSKAFVANSTSAPAVAALMTVSNEARPITIEII